MPRRRPSTHASCRGFCAAAGCWGLTCQLYGLRSERNWGIGDFEDLARLAEIVGARAATFSASTRCMRSTRPIRSAAALFALQPALPQRALYRARHRAGVRPHRAAPPRCAAPQRPGQLWRGRARKFAALEAMFQVFEARPAGSPRPSRRSDTEAARRWSATACSRRCTSITPARHGGTGRKISSRPTAPRVSRFRASHAGRIEFFAWLQWLADRQLKMAQSRAEAAGMRIGLYLDMAVGVAPDGAMAWADPEPDGARRPYRRAARCLQCARARTGG
jgi:4-alpha-glucanotransferase